MRYAISSSPLAFVIAFVGSLFAAEPAWSATWHASKVIACCPAVMRDCGLVCRRVHRRPVFSITNKNRYRVCRRFSHGETNRVGYQRTTGAYTRTCRVDDAHPASPDTPFDCLCQPIR